jgi:hypothetical protein
MSTVVATGTDAAANALGKESRRHLGATKVWLYVLAVTEALFILAALWTGRVLSVRLIVAVTCGIPVILKVRAARNIARFEQGDETALVRAIWLLRHLWVTLTIYGGIFILAAVAAVVLRFVR